MCARKMRSPENFVLKWKDFGDNIFSSFQELRRSSDFSDVTLVSSDGERVQAHQLILSLSSEFFKQALPNQHQHQPYHPMLVYMRGVDSVSLSHLVNFFYHGEVKIEQDLLASFLALAQELGVKGLTNDMNTPEIIPLPDNCDKEEHLGKSDSFEEENSFSGEIEKKIRRGESLHAEETFEEREESVVFENASSKKQKTVKVKDDKDLFEPSPRESIMAVSARLDKEFKTIIFNDSMISQNSATELDMKVEEILQNSDQGWSCSICGITSSKKTAVKRHIEAKHVTGFSHLCVFCGKTYANRHSLRSHKTGCKKEYLVHGSGH